mgnify:CR=1 FL=1
MYERTFHRENERNILTRRVWVGKVSIAKTNGRLGGAGLCSSNEQLGAPT